MSGSVTQLIQLALMTSAILAALFALSRAAIGINRFYRRMTGLYYLLAGTPAEDDTPAQPGLNSRMRAIETWMAEHDTNLKAYMSVLDELKTNGGSTIKDQVNRMESTLNTVREQVDVHARTLRDTHESVDSTSA